jgi:hypothetical protein
MKFCVLEERTIQIKQENLDINICTKLRLYMPHIDRYIAQDTLFSIDSATYEGNNGHSNREPNLNFKEKGNLRRLRLLHFQLKAFHFSGILPPSSVLSSGWNSALYDVFTVVSLLLPTIAVQIFLLY